jgi:hypothetical protein
MQQYDKLNWSNRNTMCFFISKINAILEERYPETPDTDYVVRKLGDNLGDDAWAVLNQNYAEYFPSICNKQREEIKNALRKYLDDNQIYLVAWQTESKNPDREHRLLSGINTVIKRDKTDTPRIARALAFKFGYDAWRALFHGSIYDFPLLTDDQRAVVTAQLSRNIIENLECGCPCFTLWDKENHSPIAAS